MEYSDEKIIRHVIGQDGQGALNKTDVQNGVISSNPDKGCIVILDGRKEEIHVK